MCVCVCVRLYIYLYRGGVCVCVCVHLIVSCHHHIIISYFISIIKKRQEYITRIEYKQDGGGITEGWKPEVGLYHLYKDERTQYQTNRKQNKNRTCKNKSSGQIIFISKFRKQLQLETAPLRRARGKLGGM